MMHTCVLVCTCVCCRDIHTACDCVGACFCAFCLGILVHLWLRLRVCGSCWSVRVLGSKTGFMQHSEVVPMSGHPQRMWLSCKQLQASPSPLCLNISTCPEILIHLRGLYSQSLLLNAGAELRRGMREKMHTTAIKKLVKFKVGTFWHKGWHWCE